MNIKWVGSPNFGYPDGTHGRNGESIVAIVYHVAQGTISSVDNWFNSPNNKDSSAHFCVGKDGTIHQYVAVEDAAWSNGRPGNPDLTIDWLKDALDRHISPNLRTLSIEHEGYSGDALTEPQYRSTLALSYKLIKEHNIKVDRNHLIGHYRIDSITRAGCPGSGFPWDRLFADLERLLKVQSVIQVSTATDIQIRINGKALDNLLVEPIIKDGRTLVGLRDVANALGAKVSWDEDTRIIDITT